MLFRGINKKIFRRLIVFHHFYSYVKNVLLEIGDYLPDGGITCSLDFGSPIMKQTLWA